MRHRPEYNGVVVPTHSPIRACEEHQDLVHDYLLEYAARSGRSLALVGVSLLTITFGAVAGISVLVAAGVLVCGVWAVCFPYASPETVRRVGVLKAKFLARWLGGLLLVAGLAWLVYDVVMR